MAWTRAIYVTFFFLKIPVEIEGAFMCHMAYDIC